MDLSGRGNLMFIGCKTLKLEHLLPIDKRESLFCKLQKMFLNLMFLKKQTGLALWHSSLVNNGKTCFKTFSISFAITSKVYKTRLRTNRVYCTWLLVKILLEKYLTCQLKYSVCRLNVFVYYEDCRLSKQDRINCQSYVNRWAKHFNMFP